MAAVLVAIVAVLGRQYWDQKHADSTASTTSAIANPATASDAKSPPTAGDQLVLQARLQLERRTSVTARIRHQSNLAGRTLAGFGGYWQQGRGEDMHLRFELRLNHEDTSLLQVSNGRFIWTDQHLTSGRTITRLDLRKVRSESSRPDDDLDDLATGGISLAPPEPDFSIRTGGLPTLLTVISNCFAFEPPQSMRWTPAQPLEGISQALPVFAVVGHWKPEVLAMFLPAGKGVESLPERLPQEVLLLFGQADLFPYRLEFRKILAAPAGTSPALSNAYQLSADPLTLLELSAVSFDSQVPAGQFDFAPGDANWDDLTAEYIDAIRKQREQRTAIQKKDLQR